MVWNGVNGNGLDPAYRSALTAPHVVYNRVDITDYLGKVLLTDLPIMSGSVTATLANRVARTFTFTCSADYAPLKANGTLDPSAALSPFGNRVKAYRGVQYGDGLLVYFPVFYGRLEKIRVLRNGTLNVSASDLAAEVVDGQFEAITSSSTSLIVNDQFKGLVSGAVAGATFGTSDTFSAYMPLLNWQNDRAKACDDLAAAVGGIWYPLADGRFVLRRVPWTKPGQSAVLTLTDGAGGGLLDYQAAIGRTDVNNSIVYTSERLDGSAPVSVIARDETPGSPTYWRGPFGLKPRLVQNQASIGQPEALAAAATLLASAKALTVSMENVQMVPDASLELGDLVQCSVGGGLVQTLQVVTGFTVPMMAADAMPVTLRAYTPTSS